jgi:alpha-beta hydrolase superfamily lysophospholipase
MPEPMPRIRTLTDDDGAAFEMQVFEPDATPGCVIQILHGLGEYAARYRRFAEAALRRRHAVVIHDHRGHGARAGKHGHFADSRGWHKVNRDVEIVHDAARAAFPGVPIVMLGHSMGSYLAQTFAMHYGALLAGLILSGSDWPSRLTLWPARAIAKIESLRLGRRGLSPLLESLGFGRFNRHFRPVRTGYDWLSRDADEVDRYVADPLCGGPFSCALWLDLVGGLLAIDSDHALSRVPADLPILIAGGELDPAGGDAGMARLAMHYAQTLHGRLTVRIYPGARHEMLNETNRDAVMREWLDWIDATTRSARSG